MDVVFSKLTVCRLADARLAPDGADDPLDQAFRLLSDEERRLTIRYLEEIVGSVAVTDLAGHVATRKVSSSQSDEEDVVVATVHMALYHNHIPRLATFGVIEYNDEQETIALTGAAYPLLEILEAAEDLRA